MLLSEKMITYINANTPILYITSFEEEKVDGEIGRVKNSLDYKVTEWNGADGLVDFETKVGVEIEGLLDALKYYDDPLELKKTILVIKDFLPYMEEPKIASYLKKLARRIRTEEGVEACIILVSSILSIPKELEKYITILEVGQLKDEEIQEIIKRFLATQKADEISEELMGKFSVAFKGLSEFEIISILSLAYAEEGSLDEKALDLVFEQKQQMIRKAGILEMVQRKEGLEDIGGLELLKDWLRTKAEVFKDLNRAQDFGVDIPKGVMIVGVPGCGKSLTAKAAAKAFNAPLLKLDMGRLLGKYVGESEANMRKALKLADAVSPCVLWVDELEKAFAGAGGEGGGAEVTTRLLGSLLTWMQEKTSATFVVATANDIDKVPPELLRKGRLDEIFYVDLPNKEERKQIFEIHIKKRRQENLKSIKIEKLVEETDKFSGADIEGVVKDGVEAAFLGGKECLEEKNILDAIKKTKPLGLLMEKEIDKLKEKYEKGGYRAASKKEE